MRAAENRMCILGVMHGWSGQDPEHYIKPHTNFFLLDLRIVKPYTAERAARARVQWYMVLLCADQKKSLSGAILRSVLIEPAIPIKRTVYRYCRYYSQYYYQPDPNGSFRDTQTISYYW